MRQLRPVENDDPPLFGANVVRKVAIFDGDAVAIHGVNSVKKSLAEVKITDGDVARIFEVKQVALIVTTIHLHAVAIEDDALFPDDADDAVFFAIGESIVAGGKFDIGAAGRLEVVGQAHVGLGTGCPKMKEKR